MSSFVRTTAAATASPPTGNVEPDAAGARPKARLRSALRSVSASTNKSESDEKSQMLEGGNVVPCRVVCADCFACTGRRSVDLRCRDLWLPADDQRYDEVSSDGQQRERKCRHRHDSRQPEIHLHGFVRGAQG